MENKKECTGVLLKSIQLDIIKDWYPRLYLFHHTYSLNTVSYIIVLSRHKVSFNFIIYISSRGMKIMNMIKIVNLIIFRLIHISSISLHLL